MANRIMLNETSYHGSGAIEEIATSISLISILISFFLKYPALSSVYLQSAPPFA